MRGYVDTSAGQVHYRQAGDVGPHMVLLHCANFSSNLYELTLPYLGRSLQAWAFDAPGVGLSDGPQEPTIVQLAGWLLEACDALCIEHPVVAGLHTGCRIALQMEELRPGYFAAAVLMGTGPLDVEIQRTLPIRGPHLYLETDKDGTQWSQAIARYRTIYPDQDPPTEEDGWLQHLFALSSVSKIVPKRLPWPGGAIEGQGLNAVFRGFPAPIMLLNTPEDLFSPHDEVMAGWNPNAELRLITGVGPHLMLREPERYAANVFEFLERHDLLPA